jgi:hypothetical protein
MLASGEVEGQTIKPQAQTLRLIPKRGTARNYIMIGSTRQPVGRAKPSAMISNVASKSTYQVFFRICFPLLELRFQTIWCLTKYHNGSA